MELRGSCHCKAVRFRVEADSPIPYLRCYCSICRKTAGGGGYAINLGADAHTLQVEGEDAVSVYQARIEREDGTSEVSPGRRSFCRYCASTLWVYDPRWPELVHPFASAVDTPLPKSPETVRIMLRYAAPWCELPDPAVTGERHFDEYPDESLHEWHVRHGLVGGTP